MNLPNAITIGRVLLVPCVFWLVATGHDVYAFVLFVIAGVSDALDGFIAKRWNMESELGAYLDPLADKLLIVSVFVAMAAIGSLPLWLVTVVVTRDLLIIAAVLLAWLMNHPVAIRPFQISKATTFAQIFLAATVMAERAFSLGLGELVTVLVWITGVLTALSLATYLWAWLQHMGRRGETSAPSATVRSELLSPGRDPAPRLPTAVGSEPANRSMADPQV